MGCSEVEFLPAADSVGARVIHSRFPRPIAPVTAPQERELPSTMMYYDGTLCLITADQR